MQRLRMQRLAWGRVVISGVLLCAACGDSGGDGEAEVQVPTSGSAEGNAQQALCEPFEACGGDVVGEWAIAAVCFENPESFLPASREPACADVVRDADARAAGRYEFSDDGVQTIDLRLELDLDTLWTDECVQALSGDDTLSAAALCDDLEQQYTDQADIASARCELEDEGCACLISTAEMSEMSSGDYAVAGDLVGPSPFCIDGDTLRISMTAMGLTGTIVLDRE